MRFSVVVPEKCGLSDCGPDQNGNSADCLHGVSLNSLERGSPGRNELMNRAATSLRMAMVAALGRSPWSAARL